MANQEVLSLANQAYEVERLANASHNGAHLHNVARGIPGRLWIATNVLSGLIAADSLGAVPAIERNLVDLSLEYADALIVAHVSNPIKVSE